MSLVFKHKEKGAVVGAYPVDFVARIRFQHHGGDEAVALGGSQRDADLAKEQILAADEGWGVTRLPHAHGDAVAVGVEIEPLLVVGRRFIHGPEVEDVVPVCGGEVERGLAGKRRVRGAV